MAIKLDDFIIDRVIAGVAEDFDGNLLYYLSQLNDVSINITVESKDATDANGTLVKRFYSGKQGELQATNAMLNFNILAAQSGSEKEIATSQNVINMPRIITVKAGQTVQLPGYVDGNVIKVHGLSTNGAMGTEYTKGTSASATAYGLTSAGAFTAPTTAAEDSQFVVRYQRNVTDGIKITNSADKFPDTCRLLFKVIGVEPCTADTVRAMYLEIPSFQVSPEVDLSLTTDAGISYNGTLQSDYCSSDKALYNIYFATDDDEDL